LLQQLDAVPVRGWIVDLRRNFGGNPWPMFAALAPLLGDELLGGMHTTRGSFPWRYAGGRLSLGDQPVLTLPEPFTPASLRPVVLLTGPLTISAGEALVIACRNRPHVATVGEATFGLTTTTRDYCLLDSSVLTVSDGVMADNRGEPQWGPLAPELRVPIDWTRFGTDDDPCILEARRWISRQ
jgi:carboxyl-terminal processing protease